MDKALARQRSLGYPIARLQMQQHATVDGLEMANGVMDWDWLNKQLGGVQLLLLANCAGGSVASCVRGVPYVITLDERIGPPDASALVWQFWYGIGSGLEPPDALERSLTGCAGEVREMVRGAGEGVRG